MFNYFLQFDKSSNEWKVWSVIDENKIPHNIPETDRFGTSFDGHKDCIEICKLRNQELKIQERK